MTIQIQATAKFARMSPKKIRPLANILRHQPAEQVLTQLKYHKSKSAKLLAKVIHSAVASARNNYNLKPDNLKIQHLTVDVGPSYKRYWFRSRGSSDRLLKRTSHLKVILTEINPTVIKKTVAKPTVAPAPTKTDQSVSTKSSGPRPIDESGKRPGAKRGLGRIFTPRTTNK